MKRMVMLGMFALLASVSHGASVSWGISALREPSGSNSSAAALALTSDSFYVALVFTADTGSGTGWQTTTAGAYTYGGLSSLDVQRTATGNGQITIASGQGSVSGAAGGWGNNILTQAWAESNRGADNIASFYAVIFYNSQGNASEANAEWYTVSNVYNVDLKNIASAAATINMTGIFNNEATWVQVPEPATMALLGIGVVAVGLRRRRK